MGKLTAAGEVVDGEQQRRGAVAHVSSCGVAAAVGAAAVVKFALVNV